MMIGTPDSFLLNGGMLSAGTTGTRYNWRCWGSAQAAPSSQPSTCAPCTLPNLALCPPEPKPYFSYYSKTRYNPACTYIEENPGLVLAPAPSPGKLLIEQVSQAAASTPRPSTLALSPARAPALANAAAPPRAATVIPTAPAASTTQNPIFAVGAQPPLVVRPPVVAQPPVVTPARPGNQVELQSGFDSLLGTSTAGTAGR
eukprot:jgi/Botrbrau1/2560/Bobra.0079s0046.1